jgi:PAS domain S-box-containing protein
LLRGKGKPLQSRAESPHRVRFLTPSANIEQLFESAPGCIAVVRGPDHVFEIANAAYRRLVGRTDLVGRPAAEVMPELAEQGYLALLDDVYRSGEPYFADTAPVALQREPGGPCETRFISFVYQPIRDESGAVTGIFAEGIDVTRTREAEAARLQVERRLTAVLDNAAAAIFQMDAEQRCVYMNAAAEKLTGYSLAEARGRSLHDLIHHSRPDGAPFPIDHCPIARSLAGGKRVTGEEIFVDKAGRYFPVAYTASPFVDEEGREPGTILEVRDISAEKEAASTLREREAHLSAFFSQSAAGMSEVDATGRFLRVNDRFCQITGRSREELLTLRMQDITHPGDLPRNLPLFTDAAEHGRSFDIEKRYVKPDGGLVWVHNSVTTIRDAADRPAGTICVTIDITDARRAEEHQRLLINELNHRVKNTLAIVQGIAQQSFKGREVPPAARIAFEGRLGALSAAHNILTEQNWEAASIRQIIEDAVAPHRLRPDRFVVEGPDLAIPPKTAVSLALAVHELATNAGKYGALSETAGRVEIRWRVEDGRLRLVWREQGGPPVEPPARRGFGTRMIERGLAAELGGQVTIDFRREGVVCTIDAPLPG